LNYQFREAPMSYTHLSQNERYQIYTMLDLMSVAEIAQRLGCHESTIRRELVRNRGGRGYRPKQAQVLAQVRSIGSRNAVCISPVIYQRV
jgi:IS30 family transposase